MNDVLARWNAAPRSDAVHEIKSCCGSPVWAEKLASQRPFTDVTALLAASDNIWRRLSSEDWLQAFRSHPRIGESVAGTEASWQSASWSQHEQSNVAVAGQTVKSAFEQANLAYEQKFGHIFIVCATGKSAAEILANLTCRMHNDADAELCQAAEEQRQITHLRLEKWLGV
jgi:2-oxo-4-hydroxy-4-carboxy-5-ureidoimidazoline decarboxylase